MFRKSLIFVALLVAGATAVPLAFPASSYAQSAVYSCDALTVISTGNNSISATLAYTSKYGAGMQMTTYDFGDGKIVGTDETKVTHTYAKPGTYTVSAKMRIIIDNKRTVNDVTSQKCYTTVVIGEQQEALASGIDSSGGTTNMIASSPANTTPIDKHANDLTTVSELPKTGSSDQTVGYMGVALLMFLLVTYIRQKLERA